MTRKRLEELLCAIVCMASAGVAHAGRERYTSQTLFVVPWGEVGNGFRVVMPTQPAGAEFIPPIKGPGPFEVDREGNIFVAGNQSGPSEGRKYRSDGTLLWRIQGAQKHDFSQPLEARKFTGIMSMCCDDEGNLYVRELIGTENHDKLAKYTSKGDFAGFVSTGLKNADQLRRNPGGGITFLAFRKDNSGPSGKLYPTMWKEGQAAQIPTVHGPRDAQGMPYYGHFKERYPAGTDRSASPPKVRWEPLGRRIILLRQVWSPSQQSWDRPSSATKIVVPYPHNVQAQDIIASDVAGNLYVLAYMKDERVPRDREKRMVKVDPLHAEVVAEMVMIPGVQTLDLISNPPVVVPETGDVYDFLDFSDGLHVVKYSIQR